MQRSEATPISRQLTHSARKLRGSSTGGGDDVAGSGVEGERSGAAPSGAGRSVYVREMDARTAERWGLRGVCRGSKFVGCQGGMCGRRKEKGKRAMWRSDLGEWEGGGQMGERAYLFSTRRTLSFDAWLERAVLVPYAGPRGDTGRRSSRKGPIKGVWCRRRRG